jgi:hypothetical protein
MVVVAPSTIETNQSTDGLVQAMSHVSLKEEEIKSLKGDVEKLQQEIRIKDDKMAQFQKENQALQKIIDKLKTSLKFKGLLQGDKHVIWDSIAAEVSKFKVYLNFIYDKDSMVITTKIRCIVVGDTLAKKPLEWAQNAINMLNSIPTTELQTIGVKYSSTLII